MDKFGDPIGLGPAISLGLIVFAETICAVLVALGLWTRLSTLPLIIGMGVAAFVANDGQPFEAKELAVCYMTAFIAIFFAGSGRFRIESWIRPSDFVGMKTARAAAEHELVARGLGQRRQQASSATFRVDSRGSARHKRAPSGARSSAG